MTIYPIQVSKTTVAGTVSWNTLDIPAGIMSHVCLHSADGTTTFDFDMTDADGLIVYDTDRRDKTAIHYLDDDEVHVPLTGIYTCRIYNASSDQTFTGRIMVEE